MNVEKTNVTEFRRKPCSPDAKTACPCCQAFQSKALSFSDESLWLDKRLWAISDMLMGNQSIEQFDENTVQQLALMLADYLRQRTWLEYTFFKRALFRASDDPLSKKVLRKYRKMIQNSAPQA